MITNADERQQALDEVSEAYDELIAYVSEISEEDMLAPNKAGIWSGKNLLAHLAIWEVEGTRILRDLEQGKPEVWVPADVVDKYDEYNESLVARSSDKSLAEVKDDLARSHASLMEAFSQTNLDRFDLLTGVTVEHYKMHYPDFRNVKPFRLLSDEDRNALVAEMEAAHQNFNDQIARIPDEDLLRPNTVGIWSGKDLITHLAHWHIAALDLTASLEAGQPGKWPGEGGESIDEWNEEKVSETRGMTLDESKACFDRTFNDLLESMKSSPRATRGAGIGATRFHYDLHREDFDNLSGS